MATPVLLVMTTLRWYGAARMPRALAQAGFEVTLLAPPGGLAEKSSYVTRIAYLPDGSRPAEWVHAFAATAKATRPRLVMPCDDGAFHLLHALALSPPENLQPALHREVAALIADSLGDPAHYSACADKTRLPQAAAALGLRVPAHAVVGDAAGAEAFGAAHGYPIVLRRRAAADGGRAAFVARAGDVAGGFAVALQNAAGEPTRGTEVLVRSFIHGQLRYYQASAWRGTLLAGFAGQRLPAEKPGAAPPAVNRYQRSDALREVATRLARGFGISGFFSLEGIVADGGADFHLLEINRRLVGGAHRGGAFGVDPAAALHAALDDRPSPSRTDLDPGEEHLSVSFPQEWLRDPESAWLRDYPVDVPWDEPELFEAMLGLPPSTPPAPAAQ